jgi:lipase
MKDMRPFVDRRLPGANGATMSVADWPGSKGPLVCVHGLTSSSRVFAGLATEMPDYRIFAIDCRGRGESSKSPPFGLSQHAADLAIAMEAAGIDRATLVGHSMGAYVAEAFCAEYSDKVDQVVFVDGGYYPELPPAITADALLEARFGPFLQKIRQTWKSLEEYIEFYERSGIYPGGVDDYGRAHFAYDLTGEPPVLRARIVEACAVADWRDIFDHAAVSKRLDAIDMPLLLLRAPGGLTGKGDEIIPDDVRDAILSKVPHALVADLPDTNHHTILCSIPGARAVAREIDNLFRNREKPR